jgi:hypothetical protein
MPHETTTPTDALDPCAHDSQSLKKARALLEFFKMLRRYLLETLT